jgi:Tc toxin complex TcA C-terminal TcB-binding domain/Concanavalin A-like lectin/glucanases superfamily
MPSGFHSYNDRISIASVDNNTIATNDKIIIGDFGIVRKVITQEWKLTYRFYPHFHPYASQLVKQLIEKSIPGLQREDTDYLPSDNNDGTLSILPDSTLVSLENDIEVEVLPGGEKKNVSRGTQIFLPDETAVSILANGSTTPGPTINLPGTMVLTTQPRGMRFTLTDGSNRDVHFEDKLALANEIEVRLPDNRLVRLPANTQLSLLGCKPKPKLYEKIFSTPANLLAHWKFEEGQGSLANDASGNGNHAILFNDPLWIFSEHGRTSRLSFNGVNSYVRVSNSPTLEVLGKDGSDFCVAFWIDLMQGSTRLWRSIMHKGNNDGERTFGIWMHGEDNRVHYRISTNAESNEGGDSARQIELYRPTHICYLKIGNKLKLYINGRLDSEVILEGTSISNQGPLYIGKDPWWSGVYAWFSDVRIYGRALSEQEIARLADAPSALTSRTQYTPYNLVERPYPVKDLDFSSRGAYSVYNWELFYHIPITLGIHLSKNQRFEEAQKWFHYIFDPTDDSDGPTPERFWKVKPFQYTDVKSIEEILVNLSSGADLALLQDTFNNINAWKDAPFRPHVVARYRQTAYMFKAVMAYLDNLIAWGDTLFRQDTGESINEATQIYVLAANILGPRPQAVPKKGSVRPQTYANLRADLDEFGNVLRELETDIPFDIADPNPSSTTPNSSRLSVLGSISKALYFCVPRNDKLVGYWDTVADRLFKIRNSLNIQGIFRQLPLFEPPIDPGLLAKAVAAGLDVGAIVSGLNQPLPLVRFQFLIQKAAEICQEVKSLGNNLLSAMEKEDNEALAILRNKHERIILGLSEMVKYGQLQEAIKAREGLEKTLLNSIQRYTYYERLLGKQENEIKIDEKLEELDTAALEKAAEGSDKTKFKVDEPRVDPQHIEIDLAQGLNGSTGGKKLNIEEATELQKLKDARSEQDRAALKDKIGAGLSLIPEFGVNFHFWGIGGNFNFGGSALSRAMSFWASFARTDADKLTYEASNTAKIGGYDRREQEWRFQSNLAAGEITQIFKQLRAAQIREAIAEREWSNHQKQIALVEDIERFLTDERNGKKTNQGFYAWMKREVKALYGQCFQFAFDIAKKAERALQYELGDPNLSFLQFGYLAGKEGLLAGEKLYLDIKRMEMAYHELNQREYELTKHLSILQVDPRAMIELRATGRCTVYLPEELFDMDCPGHYFRRIKSVAISIPSVTGPYTSINCTVTLLKSSIRKNPLLRDGEYTREGSEDDRFSDHFGSLQSIVTSSAQNDTGLFETNLRDERYLPFEGSGVISEWQLQLPSDVRQFDYDTISDVIIHLRYTAREAGGMLRDRAVANVKSKIEQAQAAGSMRLFSIRHEFPSEWAKFKSAEIRLSSDQKVLAEMVLNLREEHYPFWSKDRDGAPIDIRRVDLFAIPTKDTRPTVQVFDNTNGTGQPDSLVRDNSLNSIRVGKLIKIQLPEAIGRFAISFDDNSMNEILLAFTWGK